jgi:hypothetical protein
MFSGTFKDSFTNVVALILVVAGAINAYLQSVSGDINWFQLLVAVAGAVVAWFTGKDAAGKPKVQ